MKQFRNFFALLMMFVSLIMPVLLVEGAAPPLWTPGSIPGPKVSQNQNKHNLSSGMVTDISATFPYNTTWTPGRDNSIIYKAADKPDTEYSPGRQVCIFCHTPHNANVSNGAPLWNRKFSTQTFQRYSSATLQIRVNQDIRRAAGYTKATLDSGSGFGDWVPDGSTKLCLSCHDGVSLLGATSGTDAGLLRGGAITMDPSKDYMNGPDAGIKIQTRASFKPSTNKMKTGHHPVSFKYTGDGAGTIAKAITDSGKAGPYNGTYTMPTLTGVKLDKNSKMQCTTCHDPHQNQSDDNACFNNLETAVTTCSTFGNMTSRKVAPFWVYHNGSNTALQDRQAVCDACHQTTGVGTPVWDPRPPL